MITNKSSRISSLIECSGGVSCSETYRSAENDVYVLNPVEVTCTCTCNFASAHVCNPHTCITP